jgi:hypothetical protein
VKKVLNSILLLCKLRKKTGRACTQTVASSPQ